MRDVSPRIVGVVGASCLLAGWLLGSIVRPPVAHTQAPARITPDPPLPRLDIPSVADRRERLAAAMEAPSPGRNPFVFAGARASAAAEPLPPAADVPPMLTIEVPVAPPPPAWTLVGVAVDRVDDTERVTAILSNGVDVELATSGAVLPGGFTVVRVAADHAVLQDGTGSELVVRLP